MVPMDRQSQGAEETPPAGNHEQSHRRKIDAVVGPSGRLSRIPRHPKDSENGAEIATAVLLQFDRGSSRAPRVPGWQAIDGLVVSNWIWRMGTWRSRYRFASGLPDTFFC